MEESYETEIPCYFLCPISMQLMKDPVTVSTGITYDRESIEKWLFGFKKTTCPVTKQQISDAEDLTPNHNLRRFIQAWCTVNAYERIPTPKPPLDKTQIRKLLNEAKNSPESQLHCLHRIRSMAHRDESSRTQLQSAGVVEFLLSVLKTNPDSVLMDEALNILHRVELSGPDLKKLISDDDGGVLETLMHVLRNGNPESRGKTVILLKSAFEVSDPDKLNGSKPELFVQIVQILKDNKNISQQATKSGLKLLMELCPWGRNRIKAVQAGSVPVLIELLLETGERRVIELVLTVLDQLCGCAEGRAELMGHGAGLAVVSKKILRVSHAASQKSMRILNWISKYSGNSKVVQEMLDVGVVAKLCLVVQVENNQKIKDKAEKILRRHARVWKDSPCIPPRLISSYPS